MYSKFFRLVLLYITIFCVYEAIAVAKSASTEKFVIS